MKLKDFLNIKVNIIFILIAIFIICYILGQLLILWLREKNIEISSNEVILWKK